MGNIIRLEVKNDNTAVGLLEEDMVMVDTTKQPRGNAKELGVFKIDDVTFVSAFTKFGNQLLFMLPNHPIKVVPASRVEIIGTFIEQTEAIKKAPAVTGAHSTHIFA